MLSDCELIAIYMLVNSLPLSDCEITATYVLVNSFMFQCL
jgi:hypothetical protein